MRAVIHQEDAAHFVGALPFPLAGAGFRFSMVFLEKPTRMRSLTERNGRIMVMRLAMVLLMPGSLNSSASVAVFRSTPVFVIACGVAAGAVVAAGVAAGAASVAAGTFA